MNLMRPTKSHSHSMDFLFSIALFFVFAATTLVVLLLSANVYEQIVHRSANSFEQNTALAYLTEKIHQNDHEAASSIKLTQFDGCEALAISQTFNNTMYTTYIYEFEGHLKELFIQNGVQANAQAGTTILTLHHLDMKAIDDNLLQFTCYCEDGSSDSIIIGLNSESSIP